MPQYQVQDNALPRLLELIDKLKFRNRQGYGSDRVTQPQKYEGPARSSGLDSLREYFKDWSIQQGKQSPYAGVTMPSMPDMGTWSIGSKPVQDIYGIGSQPQLQPQQMPEPMPYQEAAPDLTSLVQEFKQRTSQPQAQRRQAPSYDTAGMDRLTQALSEPAYREGPNANIQEDSRARAMAWLAQQNQ